MAGALAPATAIRRPEFAARKEQPMRTGSVGLRGLALAAASALLLAGQAKLLAVEVSPPAWKIGIARAKITPEKPLWMAGYAARKAPADGTLHDLWVKVVALEPAQGGLAILVTSDLLEFPKGLGDEIAAGIVARCQVPRERVMLTASHTHCGPVIDNSLPLIYPLSDQQWADVGEYSRRLVTIIVDAAAAAQRNLAPATLWAGEGTAGFAVNRRNNREPEVIKARAEGQPLKGPSDHTVPVLAIRDAQGKLIGVVASYACHNTTLSIQQWCGDYAGFMQLALEERHPGLTAMFYVGCAGDQNPLPRREVELCQKYGGELAAAVDKVLAGPMRPLGSQLAAAFTTTPLAFAAEPNIAELEKQAQSKDYRGPWAAGVLQRYKTRGVPAPYPYPVQVWRLGPNQLWISLGGEVVVDYALRFKGQFGPTTWVNGYANDVMSYIPSHRVWEEGGYEAGAFAVYNLPGDRWREDIEDQIAATVARLVEQVRKQ